MQEAFPQAVSKVNESAKTGKAQDPIQTADKNEQPKQELKERDCAIVVRNLKPPQIHC